MMDCSLVLPKDAKPPYFATKKNGHKTSNNYESFPTSKVSHYMVHSLKYESLMPTHGVETSQWGLYDCPVHDCPMHVTLPTPNVT